jgi:hypothetical protein
MAGLPGFVSGFDVFSACADDPIARAKPAMTTALAVKRELLDDT